MGAKAVEVSARDRDAGSEKVRARQDRQVDRGHEESGI